MAAAQAAKKSGAEYVTDSKKLAAAQAAKK